MAEHAGLVLASGSPRRRELLAQLGIAFSVVVPHVDETQRPGEGPADYVRRLAVEKAAAVDGDLVLAADTCVELAGEVLGKPVDAADARRMLAALSGRSHRVHTGVAVRRGDEIETGVCTTLVTFTVLSEAQIDAYVESGEPLDKAGAYALQGAAGAFVPFVRGSVSNVIGLPLHLVAALLRDDEGVSTFPRNSGESRHTLEGEGEGWGQLASATTEPSGITI